MVGAAAVGQGLMPEDEIACCSGDGGQAGVAEDCFSGIFGRRELFNPSFKCAMKAGNATECALIGWRICKVQDALDAEAVRLR